MRTPKDKIDAREVLAIDELTDADAAAVAKAQAPAEAAAFDDELTADDSE